MQSKPENSIDMDIGGTFTDCFVQYNGRMGYAKSPTTHYNLSTGFMRAIEEAARQLDIDPALLLTMTKMVRYSTTLAMNKLIERTGPNLGLVTTEGFEDFIHIGKGAQWTDGLSKQEARNLAQVEKPIPLVSRDRIIGVKERVNHKGEVLRKLDESDLIQKLRILTDQGVRGLWFAFSGPMFIPNMKYAFGKSSKKLIRNPVLAICPSFFPMKSNPKKVNTSGP